MFKKSQKRVRAMLGNDFMNENAKRNISATIVFHFCQHSING